MIELLLLATFLVLGLFIHHGLSLGLLSDKGSVYNKTIVSKMYSGLLTTRKNNHFCPKLNKNCSYNDHLGCKFFHTLDLKTNKVVCTFNSGNEAVGRAHHENKIRTEIDKLAYVAHRHKKLTFDDKLVKHLGTKPKMLYSNLKCLEKYKFIKTYMDPLDGMTIIWKDDTDLISNGYSQRHIKEELNNRKIAY